MSVGWFPGHVSGYAYLFTFKEEQSQYKNCNLRPAPYTLRNLMLNVYNFCIINAKSFKL